jgi:FkbM family methyltransferase
MLSKLWNTVFPVKSESPVSQSTLGPVARELGNIDHFIRDLALRGLKIDTALDGGAHHADWSKLVKKYFPGANLWLFDPLEEHRAYMDDFCRQCPGSKGFVAALAQQDGEQVFTLYENLDGSSLKHEADQNMLDSGGQRMVTVRGIDSLVQNDGMPIPQLVKLDVQGYEIEVLQGAKSLFGVAEAIILEVNMYDFWPDSPVKSFVFADVVNYMLDHGYVVYDFPGLIRRPYDDAIGQIDVCFVPENGHLRKYRGWS